MVSAVNLNGATVMDGAGNAANLSLSGLSQGSPAVDTTPPALSSVAATAGSYNTGQTLTLTLNMSEAVNVTGTPTLTLNDGGTATYTGGSGSGALTFSYTVASGQNTSGLAVTAINGTVADLAGNALTTTANLPANFAGVVIDTTTPSVSSVVASGTGITAGSGVLAAGSVVTLTVNLNEAVTVAGGTPTLTLNDGATATYTGGSGTNALTFSYTVATGQNTADLVVTAVNLNSATVANGAGTAAILTGAVGNLAGTLQIDTTTSVSSVMASGTGVTAGSGDLGVGSVVTLTVNLNEAVTVATKSCRNHNIQPRSHPMTMMEPMTISVTSSSCAGEATVSSNLNCHRSNGGLGTCGPRRRSTLWTIGAGKKKREQHRGGARRAVAQRRDRQGEPDRRQAHRQRGLFGAPSAAGKHGAAAAAGDRSHRLCFMEAGRRPRPPARTEADMALCRGRDRRDVEGGARRYPRRRLPMAAR